MTMKGYTGDALGVPRAKQINQEEVIRLLFWLTAPAALQLDGEYQAFDYAL